VSSLRILVVNPIVESKITESIDKTWFETKPVSVSLDFVSLERGPSFIETVEHEELAVPDLLRVVRNGERDGYHVIIINCFGNPGLEEARKLVKIPVVGAGEASFLKAKQSGKRFTVITTVEEAVERVRRNARRYGAQPFLVSVRPLGLHVPELVQRRRLRKALVNEGKKALMEDHAEILVLGCTAMAGNAEWLFEKLGMPVIDPTKAAIDRAIEQIKNQSRSSILS